MTRRRKLTKGQRAVDLVLSAEGRLHLALDGVVSAHAAATDLLTQSTDESFARESALLEHLTVEATIRNTNRLIGQENDEVLAKVVALQGQL